jgi:hypothetical protein
MAEKSVNVDLAVSEVRDLLRLVDMGPATRKLVDGLLGATEPVLVTSVEELDALPVETAIRMGSPGRVRTRVKSVNGEWVGAGVDGPSSVRSQQVIYWYSSAEVLHMGTGWNP